jgi:hypothetical protein
VNVGKAKKLRSGGSKDAGRKEEKTKSGALHPD